MKITIEFNLPEDQQIYDNFRNAQTMRDALNEFNRYIQTKTPGTVSDEEWPAYEDVREKFNTITEGLMND